MAFVSKKDEAYRHYALNASPTKVLISSCAPLALYQALQSIFKILDAMMASHIGSDAASAVACLNQITQMITALGTGLAIGGSIKISEAYGKGDYELVRKQVGAVYSLAVIVGLIIMGVLIPFAESFLGWLKTDPELIKAGAGYFRVEILTLVVTFFNTVYIAIERSRGHAKKILVLNLIVILVKLGLSALFVYVLNEGVTMIAVATLIGQLGIMGYAFITMPRDDGAFRFSFRKISLGGKIILPILNLAYPVSAEKVLFSAGKVTVNSMSGEYGPTTVGALGISNNIGGLTTSWHMGFTNGASPLISQNRGAGKYRRTLQIFFRLLVINVLIGLAGIILVSLTLPYLANIFAQSKNEFDPAFRDTIVSIHQWEMLGYITLGINSATLALLLGYGYTKLTLLLNVARVFAFRVPVLWFFQNYTKVGVEAVGMTMMISNICVGLSAVAVAIPVVIKILKKAKAEEDTAWLKNRRNVIMTPFMNADFLLKSETAKELYHEHAEKMPIIDYHCHINPMEIYEDKRYASITEVWLGGDHYKWRAMRSCGVPEYYITGGATPAEKFQKWAETIPNLIGNPLYHWTHLELQRYFGITEPLNGDNAMEIYEKCNAILAQEDMSVRGIIKKSGVKLICTTDDPVDDLRAHELIAADPTAPAVVLPAFRPDKAMRADKETFPAYVAQLEKVVGFEINTVEDMRKALINRIAYFNDHGCRVSDHALDYCFCVEATEEELNDIFARAKAGKAITWDEQLAYHTALLICVGKEYYRLDWVMQLHFGCLRDNSRKMFRKLGPDTGFDSMNDAANAVGLAKLLGVLEDEGALGKTILYSLNPADNGIIGTIMGGFQTDSSIPGKIQQGSAWWFNDHKPGMEAQMISLMSLGAMGSFNGMLTDSRSFLSYTRHEYFRRILCNLFGQMVEDGEYPADMKALGKMVENISYNNTLNYFRFNELIK